MISQQNMCLLGLGHYAAPDHWTRTKRSKLGRHRSPISATTLSGNCQAMQTPHICNSHGSSRGHDGSCSSRGHDEPTRQYAAPKEIAEAGKKHDEDDEIHLCPVNKSTYKKETANLGSDEEETENDDTGVGQSAQDGCDAFTDDRDNAAKGTAAQPRHRQALHRAIAPANDADSGGNEECGREPGAGAETVKEPAMHPCVRIGSHKREIFESDEKISGKKPRMGVYGHEIVDSDEVVVRGRSSGSVGGAHWVCEDPLLSGEVDIVTDGGVYSSKEVSSATVTMYTPGTDTHSLARALSLSLHRHMYTCGIDSRIHTHSLSLHTHQHACA